MRRCILRRARPVEGRRGGPVRRKPDNRSDFLVRFECPRFHSPLLITVLRIGVAGDNPMAICSLRIGPAQRLICLALAALMASAPSMNLLAETTGAQSPA